MVVKCDACGKLMEVEDALPSGTHLVCPACGEELVFARPSRIELPSALERRRNTAQGINAAEPSVDMTAKPKLHIKRTSALQSPTDVRAQQIMERIQNKEIKESESRAHVKSEQRNVVIAISLLGLIVVVALTIYWRKMQNASAMQDGFRDEVFVEDSERARRQMEEENAERERRRKEAETERARRKAEADAERERKRLEREKELQEQKEKAEAERANRERIEDVERKFKSASIVFASDFAADKSPIKKDGTFYAIGLEYISDQKVYEAMVERGVVVAVRAFSTRGEPTDVEVKTFTDSIMKNRLLVMGEDGVAWICGTGKSSWIEKVSIANEDIMPAKKELGELFAILSKWGRLPNLKYRLTLKPSKNGVLVKGGNEIPLGIIEYTAAISSDRIRDAILKPLQKKRESSSDIKPPKLKKFTPTVVFYDGDIIRKGLKVTKVPRTFKHLGTKVYGTVKNRTYEQAEEQWRQLKEEAERQERRKEEIIRENAQIMREHEEKVREILNKGISGEQIEAEAQKYLLLIERSRSKLEAKQ